jgi:hypothetical protein
MLNLKSRSCHRFSFVIGKNDKVVEATKKNESELGQGNQWRKRESSKTASKIYLTIKDKVNKDVAISAMSLENEMFMAPEFVYEKPKITFE